MSIQNKKTRHKNFKLNGPPIEFLFLNTEQANGLHQTYEQDISKKLGKAFNMPACKDCETQLSLRAECFNPLCKESVYALASKKKHERKSFLISWWKKVFSKYFGKDKK